MKTAHFLSPDASKSQDLSAGALDYTFNFGRKRKLEMVTLHASVAISEEFKIILDSALGANYDVLLADVILASEQDYVFRPHGELNLQAGDKIQVTCTNANLLGTIYVNAKTSEL